MPIKCTQGSTLKDVGNYREMMYKARLVAKGFTQKFGIDYTDKFSLVVRLASLCILLAIGTY